MIVCDACRQPAGHAELLAAYLFICETAQFLTEMRIEHVECVRDMLREHGCEDAAERINTFLEMLRRTRKECEAVQQEFEKVFRAVEREVSRDGYDGQIEDAVKMRRERETV